MKEADRITVAHSPDSDDAFMFYALAEGRVDTEGLAFDHELADIETLNRRALAGELAVTAVSFHAYAYLADRYLLLPHGASFGDGYGPVVVARRPISREEIASGSVVVASPGARTTAALALSLWAPGAKTVLRRFDEILEGVRDGELEAGLLIHEGQLTFAEEGLTEVVDLGRWWKEETGLPLPLGGNVVRRDLGADRVGRISAPCRARSSTAWRTATPRSRMPCSTRAGSTRRGRTGSSACTSTTGPAATGRRAAAPSSCCSTGGTRPG